MVLCINRFAQAELIVTNNIRRVSQGAEETGCWQKLLRINLKIKIAGIIIRLSFMTTQLLQIKNDSKHLVGRTCWCREA